MEPIPKEQVLKRLAAENPWWREPHRIQEPYATWRPRPYLDLFFPLVANPAIRRAAILMGPRRVGKTVLVHHAIQRLLDRGVPPRRVFYVSVDRPLYNGRSLEELLGLYAEAAGLPDAYQGTYVFFDEIQYLHDWEKHLKALVDSCPAMKCVASGSAAAALKLKSTESGAGRFTDFLLPPLTFYEYLILSGGSELVAVDPRDQEETTLLAPDLPALNGSFLRYLNVGGYPEVALSGELQADPGRFVRSDIIDKVLLRDLPGLYGIEDTQELNSLFTTLAFNTANEISLEQLSKGSGVAKPTIRRYLEYLEAAFLIRRVHRVDRSARHFERANFFKVHLTNPSLRSALFSAVEEGDPALGALVETAVFAQWFHDDVRNLYYARWKDGEVDLVYLGPDQRVLWAAEVKWSDRALGQPQELAAALRFCHENNLQHLLVTTRTASAQVMRSSVRVEMVPAALYCATISRGILLGRDSPASNGRTARTLAGPHRG